MQVVVAPNPGPMTGPGTNTYVVGAGPSLVIDPAVDDDGYVRVLIADRGLGPERAGALVQRVVIGNRPITTREALRAQNWTGVGGILPLA